jgi:hypothetical protein
VTIDAGLMWRHVVVQRGKLPVFTRLGVAARRSAMGRTLRELCVRHTLQKCLRVVSPTSMTVQQAIESESSANAARFDVLILIAL